MAFRCGNAARLAFERGNRRVIFGCGIHGVRKLFTKYSRLFAAYANNSGKRIGAISEQDALPWLGNEVFHGNPGHVPAHVESVGHGVDGPVEARDAVFGAGFPVVVVREG